MNRLPDEIPSLYSVSLPVDPQDAQLGLTDPYQAALNRESSAQLIQAQARYHKLITNLIRPALSKPSFTVSDFTDLLLGCCLSTLIRSGQTRDQSAYQLTSFSTYWWNTYTIDSIPKEFRMFEYAGLTGTLAQYSSQSSIPQELVLTALQNFWSKLSGSQYSLSSLPKYRLRILFSSLGIQSNQFYNWEKALDTIETSSPAAFQKFRQNLFSKNSYDSLSIRILLGEINPKLIDVLQELYTPSLRIGVIFTSPEKIYQNLLSILPPVGPNLALIALGLEGWFKTYQFLVSEIEKDSSLGTLPYEFFLDDPLYSSLRRICAEYFSLSYDAWTILSIFNTYIEAKGLAHRSLLQCIQFLDSSGDSISKFGNYRLELYDQVDAIFANRSNIQSAPSVHASFNRRVPLDADRLTDPFSSRPPIQDVVLSLVNQMWDTHYTYAYIDYESVSQPQSTSVSSSINHLIGLPALNGISPYISLLQSAYKRIQGLTSKQSSRIAGWSKKHLQEVHRDSEIPAVAKLLAQSFSPNDLLSHGLMVLESGMHSTTAVSAHIPDPAHGHVVKSTTSTEQINTNKYQLEASVVGIDAGAYHVASHQHLTTSRFLHQTSDLAQSSFSQQWVRVEGQNTLISNYDVRVVDQSQSEFINSKKSWVGSYFQYADNFFIQVRHEEKSFGKNQSFSGRFSVLAESNLSLYSRNGSLLLRSQKGSVQISSTVASSFQSEGPVEISSEASISIDAPTVFINQGLGFEDLSVSDFTDFFQQIPPEFPSIKPLPKQLSPIPSPGTKQFPRQAEPPSSKAGPSIGSSLGATASILNSLIKTNLQ